MRHIWHLSNIVFAAAVQTACSNYNLKEKLENPGGSSGVTEKFSDRLFAFVTSSVTKGDMQGLVADNCTGTGMARADCVCQQLAQNNGRRMNSNSRFVAWLSTTGAPDNTMTCRILGSSGAGCAPAGGFVWYNTNMQPVFSGVSQLLNAAPNLSALLRFTETGAQTSAVVVDVWTGTDQQGTANTSNCVNWSDSTNTPLGLGGRTDLTDFSWTNSATRNCDTFLRVYCFAVP